MTRVTRDRVTTMGLSLPISLKQRLDAVAAKSQRNRSNVVQQAVRELLDRIESIDLRARK